jgi:hypothetical protein
MMRDVFAIYANEPPTAFPIFSSFEMDADAAKT